MKLNFTRLLFVLVAVVFFYASCKKTNVPSVSDTTNAVDFKTLSSQLGTQFYKSITGQFGGTDVNKGITSPQTSVTTSKQFSLNSIAPLCGTVIDTTYKTTIGTDPVKDTVKKHFENFHFVYTCDGGVVDGYLVRDSLVNVANYGFFVFDTNAITQYYAVKALDQTYKLVSMDGSLSSLVQTQNSEALSSNSTASIYYLVGLRVNFASGAADITAGTTSFKTTITVYGPSTNFVHQVTTYYGTIQYLGNHKAKVTFIPGAAYIVDLITGVATPA